MSNIPSFANIIYNSSLSGSTGAKLYKNRTGKKWVVKKGAANATYVASGKNEQVEIEALANTVYRTVGIPVPRFKIDAEKLVLEHIDGKLLKDATPEEFEKAKSELCQGFIIDALIANWDVIGMFSDNIIMPSDGSPAVRIDNGGSFTLKATGGKKPFTKTVAELDTMRNKKIAPQASKIFGGLSESDIDTQIKTLIVPNYDSILNLMPDTLKNTMKSRLDYLVERTVWTNASHFKNNVVETQQSEYIPQIQTALVNFFRDGWLHHFNTASTIPSEESDARLLAYINGILKEHDAIVSGGFILKAIGSFVDEKSVDIDIYVPSVHAEPFRIIMAKLFNFKNVKSHIAADINSVGSFFKKNGIVSVNKYSKLIPNYAEMDIVEVAEDRTPVVVVKNFDLTFCENWYDGENLFMTHPEHVKTKHGFLENHYLKLLYSGNPVLINRMKKYIGRGFRVSINNPKTKLAENITDGIVANTLFQQQVSNLTNITNVPPIANYGSYGTNGANEASQSLIKNSLENNARSVVLNNMHLYSTAATAINTTATRMIRPTTISSFDKALLRLYTDEGYYDINRFLYSNDYNNRDTINTRAYKAVQQKYPKAAGESAKDYITRTLYYLTVNLYNFIQRAPPISTTPFIVYRGTEKWYLEQATDRFYYVNSFMSTSSDILVAKSFTSKNNIYMLYIHPYCRYMNITSLSQHDENEILFTPYHRYIHVGNEDNGIVQIRKYVVLPTDLDIPKTFEEFMPWKYTIAALSKVVSGGRRNVPLRNEIRLMLTRNRLKNTSRKIDKGNTAKKRLNTMKNTMRSAPAPAPAAPAKSNNYPTDDSRFNAPLPSFPGKPITDKEKIAVQAILDYFKTK